MHRPRPIVVIDTSVFISDALSRTQAGAASQVLAILPAVATIITCEDIREELTEKLVERFGWTRRQVAETYGPIFDVALWLVPVEEQPIHRKVVHGDPDDTVLPRAAEAVFTQATTLLELDQEKFIVTGNPRHLRPGTNYAGFLFVTPHALLVRLRHRQASDGRPPAAGAHSNSDQGSR